jgi:hypothetical protein
MRWPWTSRRMERRFNEKWGDLAQYNAERTRGIMHTASWHVRMAAKQREYNEACEHREIWA